MAAFEILGRALFVIDGSQRSVHVGSRGQHILNANEKCINEKKVTFQQTQYKITKKFSLL